MRFPEQPFVFYPLDDGTTLWDGLRHTGMLRSVARKLSQSTGDAPAQGSAFEQNIAQALTERFGITALRGLKLRVRKQVVGEIDVAFAWHGVLFVMEAKNEIHNIRHFFEGGQVVKRVDLVRKYRDRADLLLRRHRALIRDKVPMAADTTGAIVVVCTREVEFIPSLVAEWWLTRTCPRVCRLAELLDALPELDGEELAMHPSFVPWGEG